MSKPTRRAFLKMAGAGLAAAALYKVGSRTPLLRALSPEEQAAAQAHEDLRGRRKQSPRQPSKPTILRSEGKGSVESRPYLAYVGHATVFLEIDGVRLLTDPVLRRRVGPLLRQVDTPHPSYREVDVVLISHAHWDHLDPPSLRLLEGDPHFIVPGGTASFLRAQGMRRVQEMAPGEQTVIGDVVVEATLAHHSGRRPPFGSATDCVGFLIRGSHQIYFAGDTDLFPEMRDLGDDLDIALLPVWGWGPTLGAGHMDPLRAAQSLIDLCPPIAIPIHWGTYCPIGIGWMRLPFLSCPPRDFAAFAAALAPSVEVCILEPGQSLDLANRPVYGPRPESSRS